jgi:glycosyltransferase involved in cell wall biosynthesis
MKVLHVIPSVSERSGGPATAIVPMCRALMREGVEVLLLTTYDGLRQDEVSSEYKGVPAIFFPSQLGASFKYSRPLANWLDTNIGHFDLAHIHSVFNHSSVAAAHVCRKAGVPYIVRPLGTLEPWSMGQKALRKRVFWQVSGKGIMRRAAAVHYTTEAEKLATERLLGLNHGKVVALGVEANSAVSSIEHHFPSLAGERYVLVLSRLHPKKGLDVLIEAFLSLVQTQKLGHWRLVIAGDGPLDYVLKLKARVATSSQRDRIVFTGWLDGEKKNTVLAGASLLALPSHQENFGLCVMEALSHSVPVLISPAVSLAAEIAAANAGWIAANDKDSLTTKLAEALADEDELSKRGRAGKRLSTKYSWENAARDLAALYQDVFSRRLNGS